VAASFSADNDSSASNGIQAGEELGITFDLIDGLTYTDTVNALINGDLVIGIHAQGLGLDQTNEYSESIISTSTVPVPVPTAVWLFGSGLIGLVGFARNKKA